MHTSAVTQLHGCIHTCTLQLPSSSLIICLLQLSRSLMPVCTCTPAAQQLPHYMHTSAVKQLHACTYMYPSCPAAHILYAHPSCQTASCSAETHRLCAHTAFANTCMHRSTHFSHSTHMLNNPVTESGSTY